MACPVSKGVNRLRGTGRSNWNYALKFQVSILFWFNTAIPLLGISVFELLLSRKFKMLFRTPIRYCPDSISWREAL